MRYNEFLSEDELFEINMSPNNLTKLVKEIPGAMVGLEFEMIVPGAQIEDDSNTGENDYDQDERCDDIDDIVAFFQRGNGGDFNNADRLRDRLQEAYFDWVGDQSGNAWGNVAGSEVHDWIENNTSIKEDAMSEYRDENPDADDDEVETAGETAFEAAYDEAMDEAWGNEYYDSAHEQWREDYESDLSERDWLRGEGYRYMSDIENHFDETYWPYQHSAESETDIDGIGEEFSDAVGREVKASAGYHNIDRGSQASEGFYILETDGSLRPNDPSDESGLEFVSPPLPLADMMTEIGKVAAWAKQRGAYTGKSNKTGLHMNVSVPNYDKSKLDFVKLALLLGDNHILKEFDRYVVQGTNYAQSSFDLLAKSFKDKPQKAQEMMEKMKGHFDLAASKAIHSGNTDKYTSINVKDNRVEFRGPGNDYLGLFAKDPNKLLAPMMRMVVALEAACDPEKYRDEYQKKLYKLLSSSVKSKDTLSLFTDYAAGKGIPQTAFKSFLKQRKGERDLSKGIMPGDIAVVGGRKSNPDGSWILFKQNSTGDIITPYKVEVLYRFNAANGEDAEIVRNRYAQERNIDTADVKIGSDPTKKYGQPQPAKDKNDIGNASWGVYRKVDGHHMKSNGDFIVFKDTTYAGATSQLRDLIGARSVANVNIDNFELLPLTKYELYRVANGRTVEYDNKPIEFLASNPEDAQRKIPRYVIDFAIPGETSTPGAADEFAVRSVLTPPANTTTTTQRSEPEQPRTAAVRTAQATAANGVPMWAIYRISDGEVVHRFADHASSHSRTALSWLRDQNYDNPTMLFRVRAMSQDEQPTRQFGDPSEQPNWEIERDRDHTVVHRLHANSQEDAVDQYNNFLRMQGWSGNDYTLQSAEHSANQAARPGSTTDLQQQRAQGGFTGSWKLVDGSGAEVYRFGGVGNSQHDANRVAAQWLRDQGIIDSSQYEVYPIMGNN